VGVSADEDAVRVLYQSADGHVWLGTFRHGLLEYDGHEFRNYTTAHGLMANRIESVAEDSGGNLWIGAVGAMRLARNGFVTYGASDGLASTEIASIFDDSAGNMYVVGDRWRIHRMDGRRFTNVRPNLSSRITDSGWRGYRSSMRDHLGNWWVATGEGLYRFVNPGRIENLATKRPVIYTVADGLSQNDVAGLFEDSRGDIWISYFVPADPDATISRWTRATGRFLSYGAKDGLPPWDRATAFQEDTAGGVWFAFYDSGLRRYAEGRFQSFGEAEGIHAPNRIHVDRDGRLWVSTYGSGVLRLDNPTTDHPTFTRYTVHEGLAGNVAHTIADDNRGGIYFGTRFGLGHLDPATGRIQNYGITDGLMSVNTYTAFCDRSGALRVGSDQGLSRHFLQTGPNQTAPSVLIGGLRSGVETFPLTDFGANWALAIELTSVQRQVTIDYFALTFSVGDLFRYQYKLEGADTDWSAPSDQRTVNYASLAPGTYRFLVRAVGYSGQAAGTPARVAFTVPAPVWRRWWFLTLCALAVAAAIYGFYRYQLGQALALERMRTRIATDLHDDIGSSLSQIAIMSELAKRSGNDAAVSEIANMARDLVDAMSEIVWAINPRHDHVSNLLHRMRRFASDTLAARGIALEFRTLGLERDLRASADLRRQVFLIFKEGIVNIARHSEAQRVEATLELSDGALKLSLQDDGRGFDPEQLRDGNGLRNMPERSRKIGGTLSVASQPGRGTTLVLTVPLAPEVYRPG
jgi:signal transduction histidine kinase